MKTDRPVGQILEVMKSSTGRKTQILLVSAELFSRKGYDKTSMKDIANKVGISKSTLYCYIKNKHELLYTIMASDVMEYGIGGLQKIKEMSIPIDEKIRLGIHHHLSSYERYISEYVVMLHEKTDSLPYNLKKKIKEKFKAYTSLWNNLIDEAITCEVVRRGLDPKIIVWSILGMCNWVYKWYSKGGRLTNSEIADIFYQVMSQGAFVKRR